MSLNRVSCSGTSLIQMPATTAGMETATTGSIATTPCTQSTSNENTGTTTGSQNISSGNTITSVVI
jgi:hypothetical protein